MPFKATSLWDRGQVGVLEDHDSLLVEVTDKEGKDIGPLLMNADEYIYFNGEAGERDILRLAREKNPNIDCRLFLQKHPLSK